MSPLEVLRRGGDVTDGIFDGLYPDWVQDLSELFWTPVSVAMLAGSWLATSQDSHVLDVGAGVGKFALVGAATTGAVFHGIEQRALLVDVARDVLAAHSWLGEHVFFEQGNFVETSWESYQGIYLFNPFGEQTAGPFCQIDDSLSHSPETAKRYVDNVVEKLLSTACGTRVVTYFGFGGHMPEGFTRVRYEHLDFGPLELWIRD